MPSQGRNPFHDPSSTEPESGTYQLYITSTGDKGDPHTHHTQTTHRDRDWQISTQ